MLRCALLLQLLLTVVGSEVTLHVESTTSAPSEVRAQVLLGNYPFTEPFRTGTGLVPVKLSAGCTDFDGTDDLRDRTALVRNPEECAGRGGGYSLLQILLRRQAGNVAAVIADSAENTGFGEPNWGLKGDVGLFGNYQGMVFRAPSSWVRLLADEPSSMRSSSHLRATMFVEQLLVGAEVQGAVATGHMQYYHADIGSQGDVTVTVTPNYGNPDLFVNAVTVQQGAYSNVDGRNGPYPSLASARGMQTSPGDDAYTLWRKDLPSGNISMLLGIYGEENATYALLVSSTADSVRLTSGQPKRFEVPLGDIRYFSIEVPSTLDLRVAVTPLTGDPDLFISVVESRPNFQSSQWSSVGSSHRYEHIEVPVTDVTRRRSCLATAPSCTFHLAVRANSATTFSIVAVTGTGTDARIQLVNGLPQAGFTVPPQTSRYYLVRVPGTHSDVTVRLTMQYGTAHIYARNVLTDHVWNSEPLSGGDEILKINHTDSHFCAICDYKVSVKAENASSFTISAVSSGALAVLEDGSPVNEVVAKGQYEYFKMFLSRPGDDVQLVMTSFLGNPDMFVSTTSSRPNITSHEFSSEDTAGDIITIRHDDPKLLRCMSTSSICVIYVSVLGKDGDASFSLTASAISSSSGFHITFPPSIAGEYSFTRAIFGSPLPERPLSANIVYANPHHACRALNNPPADVQDAIVMLDRGPTNDTECPFPGRYFANKVAIAQDAKARAVIVVNDHAGPLVYMGGVSGDHAQRVTIPSIFISKADGDTIKAHLGPQLSASLSRPHNRYPILVPGVPMRGMSKRNELVYYEVLTSPGSDDFTITVAAQYGNPDLFVSAEGILPTQRYYDWSSRSSGSETLVIPANDPKMCKSCVLVIGVLAVLSNSQFTITTSVAETLVTLLANVPMPAQRVSLGSYKYYRFYVDQRTAGFTIALTVQSGDADLFVSFEHERPTKEHHTWNATGRTGCLDVDCGTSIAYGDAIHISAAESRAGHTCTHWPCLAYVGVYGALRSSFTILMTEQDNELPVQLLEGVETRKRLPAAGTCAYFTFIAPASVRSFYVKVHPLSGDPDLYITDGADFPSRDQYKWRSATDRDDEVHVALSDTACHAPIGIDEDGGDDAGSTGGCLYKIAVWAWRDNTEFGIIVTTEQGEQILQDGQSTGSLQLRGRQTRDFKIAIDGNEDVEILFVPESPDAVLRTRFSTESELQPTEWVDRTTCGTEAFVLFHADGTFCNGVKTADGCVLLLQAESPTNTTFSLTVTSVGNSHATQLPLGAEYCGSLTNEVKNFQLSRYEDDEVVLEIDQCFGQAKVHASQSLSSTAFVEGGPPAGELGDNSIALSLPKQWTGSAVRARVSAASNSTAFCFAARNASASYILPQSLRGASGEPRWVSETRLELQLAVKPLDTIQLHGYPTSKIAYDVYYAPLRSGIVMSTWCGVQCNGRRLGSFNDVAPANGEIRLVIPLLDARKPSASSASCPRCPLIGRASDDEFVLLDQKPYLVTVVAKTADTRVIYAPMSWTPGAPHGGANGFVVFLEVVFVLGLLGGLGYGLFVAKQKGVTPSDVADFARDRAAKLDEQVRQLQIPARWRNLVQSARGATAPPQTRVRVGDGMRAPLTSDQDNLAPLNCAHVPVATRPMTDSGMLSAPIINQPLQMGQVSVPLASSGRSAGLSTGFATGAMAVSTATMAETVSAPPIQASIEDNSVDDQPSLLPLAMPTSVPVIATATEQDAELPISTASVVQEYDMDE